jgi:hypothetical protein
MNVVNGFVVKKAKMKIASAQEKTMVRPVTVFSFVE